MGTIYHPQLQDKVDLAAAFGPNDDRGGWDASGNVFPSTGGSGSGGAIEQGNYWLITVAGTLGGTPVSPGWTIRALIDAPGQTAINWSITAPPSGGVVTSVYGRTGAVVAATNDYTWAQINKTTSSLADIATRSASDLTSGTLPDARFPATLPAISGANLTNLNAGNLSSGTLPDATFPAILPAISGQNLTSLNANNISSGTLATARGGTGTGTTFTQGSIVFAGASGVYSQNNANLFWDNGNARLGVGTATPGHKLEVAGNLFLNTATANLYMKDTSTGWQAASTTVITPQASNVIRSTSYTSGLIGWNISAGGNAEFANVDVRGAIHSAIFTYNAINATAGTLGVFKSAAKLRTDVVVPASPVYGTDTVVIEVEDAEGISHAASQLFVGNDILRLKDGLVGDTWFKINALSDQTTFWRYSAIIMAGSNNVTYRKGMAVADYGLSGQGFIIQTADQTNAPYLQMATHAAGFTSSDASGSLVVTPRLRLGNLNGSYGYATDVYGFGTGQYGASGSWVTVDPTNGVRIGNSTTTRIQLAADGSGFLANNNISWTTAGVASISGWTISTTALTNNEVKIAAGVDIANIAGTGEAWFGKGSTGMYGLFLKGTTAAHLNMFAGVPSIGTAGRPYLHLNDGTRARVVLGELNTTAWDGVATNSMGMKIWSSAGVKLVEFSDVQNIIAGWTIAQTKISSTGIDIHSGASAALAFGTTPPTSASVGTGMWIDRTGWYGLASSVVQAKMDAATGKILAGAGDVVLDAGGITIFGDNTFKSTATIKFKDVGGGTAGSGSLTYQNGGIGFEKTTLLRAESSDALGLSELALISLSSSSGNTVGMVAKSYGASHSTLASKGFIQIGASDGTIITNGMVPADPVASAVLEVRSTTGAFLPPRMTTTQKNALTPAAGMIVYDLTLAKLQHYEGGAWISFN